MKILRIINSLGMGGAERSLETNVPIHIKHGYETDILLLSPSKTPFYEKLEDSGVKIYTTSTASIYNPVHVLKIIPFLKRYDIIHVHLFPALYWACFAKIISFSKTPLIYTEHSTSNNRRGRFLFKIIDRFVYKRYCHIITISDATTRNLIEHIGPRDNVTTIYNGVNLAPFHNKCEKVELFPYSNKYKIITQIASFRYPKDQKTTIRAIRQLGDNVHLVLVGTGNTMEECMLLAKDLGVDNRVHFLKNRTDIPSIVASSDIIVMSSMYEGFGRAAIEGMAGRKPVIASDVPGLRDLVVDAGLLFPAGDDHALAECLTRLLSSSSLYDSVSSACFDRSKEYDVSKMIAGYEAVYDKVIANEKAK